MMFVKVLLLVAAVSADNRLIAANGDWEDCDNWTVGCPASSVTYNAVIDKAIVFDTSDANGHSEGTEITIEGPDGVLTIDCDDCVFIIGDTDTHAPTKAPTKAPTDAPTKAPTDAPTKAPTDAPTKAPTDAPTKAPTDAPTKAPTDAPTHSPTLHACDDGSHGCDLTSTYCAAVEDTSEDGVTHEHTCECLDGFVTDSSSTISCAATDAPTDAPTAAPTDAPTATPTDAPTAAPTDAPTATPTDAPTAAPTDAPTASPTEQCSVTCQFVTMSDGRSKIAVNHDTTSGHTKHMCYKQGCGSQDTIGCTCACTCSEDGVTFDVGTWSDHDTDATAGHGALWNALGNHRGSITATGHRSATNAQDDNWSDHHLFSASPTGAPTHAPTDAPTDAPTAAPTKAPTDAPTKAPTDAPTKAPTDAPTQNPTHACENDGIKIIDFDWMFDATQAAIHGTDGEGETIKLVDSKLTISDTKFIIKAC